MTCLDTGVLIAFLDGDDPYHRTARLAVLESIAAGAILLPGIAYAETLVAVVRSGGGTEWFRTMLGRMRITVGSCSEAVLARAAQLRAQTLQDKRQRQWKLPDALIVAEAIEGGAETLVTTDKSWPVLIDGPTVKVLAVD